MTPQSLFSLHMKFGTLILEAQSVMALRMMAMGGLIPALPGENARMMAEKGPAMTKAYAAATEAMLKGQRPDQVMQAAMVPVSREVRSNRKRLSK